MKFKDKEEGSITLEAALVMPIFVFFVVFLMFMIKFSLTDIALNRAATETAKQIATQAYPIDRTAKVIGQKIEETDLYQEVKEGIQNVETEIVNIMGEEEFKNLVVEPTKNAGKYMIDTGTSKVIEKMVKKHLVDAEKFGFLDRGNVEAEASLWGNDNFVEIVVTYNIKLPIPFVEKEYIFKKKAYERLWLGA